MLYQLVAFYTIDSGAAPSLWEYLAWTVIIFQNAAVLEVIVGNLRGCLEMNWFCLLFN